MTETLQHWDRILFLWLNGLHTDWLDPVMFFLTKILAWLPLYAFLIYLIFRHHKKNGWWFLLGAAIAIMISDQIMTSFMKPYFARLRPSHEPALQGLIHLVNGYKGGLYGFASGHAATTFAVATFVWLSLRKYVAWIGWIFLWACIMTYTRIYLGVHYPSDILVGAITGTFFGWLVWNGIARIDKAVAKQKRAKMPPQ